MEWGTNHHSTLYADPTLNNKGEDRTLRTVFTHDHFVLLLTNKLVCMLGYWLSLKTSVWIDPVSNASNPDTLGRKGGRSVLTAFSAGKGSKPMQVNDGVPTSWQANIVTADEADSYREFAFEFQDLQLAYLPGSRDTLVPYPHYDNHDADTFRQLVADTYLGWYDPNFAVLTPQRNPANEHYTSQLVSAFTTAGTYSMNYRNEPTTSRISNPMEWNVNGTTDSTAGIIPPQYRKQLPITASVTDTVNKIYVQADGIPGDASYVFSSDPSITRANSQYMTQPTAGAPVDPASPDGAKFPYNALTPGMEATDPYTPLIRAYANDRVQIRTLVGAHVIPHIFNIHGAKWHFEPSATNSGFRSSQWMGISEHFEMMFKLPANGSNTDYLYSPASTKSESKMVLGVSCGLMRINKINCCLYRTIHQIPKTCL